MKSSRSDVDDGYIYPGKNNKENRLRVYIKSSYELGYVLGAVVSAGHYHVDYYRYPLKITSMSLDNAEKLVRCIDYAFGVDSRVYELKTGKDEYGVIIEGDRKLLFEFFKMHFGLKPYNRKIPNELLVGHGEYLLGILDSIHEIWANKQTYNSNLYVYELLVLLTDAQLRGKIPLKRASDT